MTQEVEWKSQQKKFLSNRIAESLGYAHIAIAVGDKQAVDKYAERFVKDGYPLLNGPRTTGDGYYEAVIQDPEGNLIELTTTLDEEHKKNREWVRGFGS